MLIQSTSSNVPQVLYTAAQVRQLDALTIAQTEGGGYALMRLAGRAAFRHLLRHFPEAASIAVFCGGGNNGGDGYVIAEMAKQIGKAVRVIALSNPEKLKGEAAEAWQNASESGIVAEMPELSLIKEILNDCDVVVDAMLGTGLTGHVREDYAGVIDVINLSGKPVLAVDIPSGLSADTGMMLGATVKAVITSTFIGIKRGLLTGQSADVVGDLWFDDLGVSDDVFGCVLSSVTRSNFAESRTLLPTRDRTAHKGQCGHVLVVGGDSGFGGAVLMASEAACRSGAGLVSCATIPSHIGPGLARVPEVMFREVAHRQTLEEMLTSASVVALGPGLGSGPWGQMCFQTALQYCQQYNMPLVVDADGLNILAANHLQLPEMTVLTPHLGEAARLLGCSVQDVMADRFASAETLAEKYQATVVLKGAGTLVAASGNGNTRINVVAEHGNPGMAAGGMGDVLTGMVASMIAQGMDSFNAACLAVSWHASSADMAAAKTGEPGLTATDVIAGLGDAWKQAVTLQEAGRE